jgi:hypothetical protein
MLCPQTRLPLRQWLQLHQRSLRRQRQQPPLPCSWISGIWIF